MRVIASDEAVAYVQKAGGRLFAWTTAHRCCGGGLTLLDVATTRPPKRSFDLVSSGDFDLYLSASRFSEADELVIELSGRRRRLKAFLNGCAYVV
jgi:hypothetical protein